MKPETQQALDRMAQQVADYQPPYKVKPSKKHPKGKPPKK